MSKNIKILIIAAVIIIILAAGGLMFLNSNKSLVNKINTPTTTTGENAKPTQAGALNSIKNLLSGGKTQSCTISYPDNKGAGTILVSDKKFRGDFTIKEKDKEILSHVISDGTYLYVWTSESPTGVKMKMDAVEKNVSPGQAQGIDLNQQVNLNCSAWIADNSKFTIPTNIKFTDLSGLLQQAPTGTIKVNQAALCNQLTDASAKAACLKAVNSQ